MANTKPALARQQCFTRIPRLPRRRTRELELSGPTWRAPSVVEVLRSLPFLHHLPQVTAGMCLSLALVLRGEVVCLSS